MANRLAWLSVLFGLLLDMGGPRSFASDLPNLTITRDDDITFLRTLPIAFPMRPVSPEKAEDLFQLIKAEQSLNWNDPHDGCFARAHIISDFLIAIGVDVRKVWALGLVSPAEMAMVHWSDHVAPLIAVQAPEHPIEYWVLDPALRRHEPIPLDEWVYALRFKEMSLVITSVHSYSTNMSGKFRKISEEEWDNSILEAFFSLEKLKKIRTYR